MSNHALNFPDTFKVKQFQIHYEVTVCTPNFRNTSSRGATDTVPSEVILKNFHWISQDLIIK